MKQRLFVFAFLFAVVSCQKTSEVTPDSQTESLSRSTGGVSIFREGDEVADCGQLRTQTPGGWGTTPHGNNPGTYSYANFDIAFPSGLTIGCSPDFTIHLTSASAVSNFLPSGGKAQTLSMNYVDPTGFKNVLAGHLVALTLSVGYDEADQSFGQAGINLGAMKIKNGAFAGWAVSDFLIEANQVIGGCSKQFTVQQVLTTTSQINENYVDGTSDNGYLICPN